MLNHFMMVSTSLSFAPAPLYLSVFLALLVATLAYVLVRLFGVGNQQIYRRRVSFDGIKMASLSAVKIPFNFEISKQQQSKGKINLLLVVQPCCTPLAWLKFSASPSRC